MDNPYVSIWEERKRQDEKWGEQNHLPTRWITILGEEFGKVCKACLEVDGTLEQELVQLGAVVVAMLESMERNSGR